MEDVTHTLGTFLKSTVFHHFKNYNVAIPIYIYISHSNLGINANKPKLYCALSVLDGRLQPAFFASLVKSPYTLTGIDEWLNLKMSRSIEVTSTIHQLECSQHHGKDSTMFHA